MLECLNCWRCWPFCVFFMRRKEEGEEQKWMIQDHCTGRRADVWWHQNVHFVFRFVSYLLFAICHLPFLEIWHHLKEVPFLFSHEMKQSHAKGSVLHAEKRRTSTCEFADRIARVSIQAFRTHVPTKWREENNYCSFSTTTIITITTITWEEGWW